MAAIYLIRHGQASFGSDNYDQLSEKGKRQATVLGTHLKQRGIQFDAVFSGAMQRHAQTAEYCLQAMDCELPSSILPGLNEYDHETVFARHAPELQDKNSMAHFLAGFPNPAKAFQLEFEKAVTRWISGQFDHDYPESWPQFRARCIEALNAIRNSPAKSIAVFSSGGPIAATTGHVLGLSDERCIEINWAIMNCSITCLLFNNEKTSLRYFNDFSHFETGDKQLLTHR